MSTTPSPPADAPLDEYVTAIEETMLQLGWAAYRRMSQELAEFGLTLPQYVTLKTLYHADMPTTMSDLAASARQVLPTMTGIVDRLVERELISRRRDPDDRRSLLVSITAKGKALIDAIKKSKRDRLFDFLELLTPQERHDFVRLTKSYLRAVYKLPDSV